MKFIVDCMCGKLAKWLKILGFDTLYFSKIDDKELLFLAEKEDRILLSRDNLLIKKSRNLSSLFIESENWNEQLEQVLGEFNLWDEVKPNSRCLECNVELKNLSRKQVWNLVTPFVYKHGKLFALCPICGRVYWKGSHSKDMEFRIGEILNKQKEIKHPKSGENKN